MKQIFQLQAENIQLKQEITDRNLAPCVSIVVTPSEIRNWRQLSNYETLLT